jgi:hypothetical protein
VEIEVQRAADRLHPDKGCGGLAAWRYDLLPDRSKSAWPSCRPERPFVKEGAPSKVEMMCRSSFMNADGLMTALSRWSAALLQPNDLSRSLVALDQNSKIIAVVALSHSSWLVGGVVPDIERQSAQKAGAEPRTAAWPAASLAR